MCVEIVMKAAVWYILMKIYYKFFEDGATDKETSMNVKLLSSLNIFLFKTL